MSIVVKTNEEWTVVLKFDQLIQTFESGGQSCYMSIYNYRPIGDSLTTHDDILLLMSRATT
jgi:hypothetical protein